MTKAARRTAQKGARGKVLSSLPDGRRLPEPIAVRIARAGDARRIANLSGQLGYPATSRDVKRRLQRIQRLEAHAVYVAELPSRGVVGWVHVHMSYLVEEDRQAEIGGLVVDRGVRGRGTGRLLMQRAEEWARAQGCGAVRLRTNVVRKDAHRFYRKIGYRQTKTQRVFHKVLQAE